MKERRPDTADVDAIKCPIITTKCAQLWERLPCLDNGLVFTTMSSAFGNVTCVWQFRRQRRSGVTDTLKPTTTSTENKQQTEDHSHKVDVVRNNCILVDVAERGEIKHRHILRIAWNNVSRPTEEEIKR